MYFIKDENSYKVIQKENEAMTYRLYTAYVGDVPNTNLVLNPEDKINITLYGIELNVTAEWLYCYGKLKIRFLPGYEDMVKDLDLFIPNLPGDKSMANKSPKAYFRTNREISIILPGYKSPTVFRVIPYSPMFAISKEGFILNLKTRDINFGAPVSKENSYIRISLNNVQFQLHVLVASAWCENLDPKHRIVVDHINGIKTDYRAENLRWVTQSDNTHYAVASGTFFNALKCLLKNLTTGKITEYPSTTSAMRAIGRGGINLKNLNISRDKPYIFKLNNMWYQLQMYSDNPVWTTLEDAVDNYNRVYRQRYILTIKSRSNPNYIYTYDNLEDISNFIKDGKKYISLKEAMGAIEKTKNYYLTLEEISESSKSRYIAYNRETGEVIYADSTTPLITMTGVTKSSIRKSAFFNGKYEFNNWVFKIDDGTDFDPVEDIYNRPKGIRFVKDNEVLEFNSIREASKYFNISNNTLRYTISKNNTFNGYNIEEL